TFDYNYGRMTRIGATPLDYDSNGPLVRLGGVRFAYKDGRISQIAYLPVVYDRNGRVVSLGGVRFSYDYGTLKQIVGQVPGVTIAVTSVVEFRRRLAALQ
ncbi:MAG TPA: hypothetical protein VLS90_16305, partial [Thermodesulfobacteriota bacterium]|nr:hypothetical protein [Thermodesulfobacteriota bacterium]